jgi:glycosyltransferase involved in cell wall biosynthesis
VDFWKHAICLQAARTFGARTVFQLHGGAFGAFFEEMNEPQRWLTRRAFGIADRVLALSTYWRQFLSQLAPASRIDILNNPVDCDRLTPAPRDTDPNNPTLLLLGRLGTAKGHYDVIKALPLILRKHPTVRVRFAGGDDEVGATEKLKSLVRDADLTDHFDFLGPVSFDPKVELLRTSTIMILPSYTENMPISVIEGMAAHMPVVATRVGALPEVLDDGRAGLLIEAGDPKGLADSVNRLLDDPTLAADLGELAAARARRLWDVGRIAGQLGAVYRDLLGT